MTSETLENPIFVLFHLIHPMLPNANHVTPTVVACKCQEVSPHPSLLEPVSQKSRNFSGLFQVLQFPLYLIKI